MISSIELARICGVSKGTVDRALHNRKGVSEATRTRILAAAETHGYRPHPEIGALVGGTSMTVGAAFPTLRSVFFMDAMIAIQEQLAQRGLRLHMCPYAGESEFLDTLQDFAARKLRAAVVFPPAEHVVLPDHLDFPIVSLRVPLSGKNTLFVGPDHVRTGRQAVEYLIGRGHTRIVHVTFPDRAKDGWVRPYKGRWQGYEEEMKGRGLEPHVVVADDEEARVVSELRALKPTALFCHNDWLAARVMRYLSRADIRVPEEISVMGVDDTPTFAELLSDLTTLHYPLAELAERVADWIVAEKQPQPFPPMTVTERDSVRSV